MKDLEEFNKAVERNHRLSYCNICQKRQSDIQKSSICSLTQEFARFEGKCNDYVLDKERKKELTAKIIKRIEWDMQPRSFSDLFAYEDTHVVRQYLMPKNAENIEIRPARFRHVEASSTTIIAGMSFFFSSATFVMDIVRRGDFNEIALVIAVFSAVAGINSNASDHQKATFIAVDEKGITFGEQNIPYQHILYAYVETDTENKHETMVLMLTYGEEQRIELYNLKDRIELRALVHAYMEAFENKALKE